VTRNLTIDGQATWLEGVVLMALYAMLGFGFYSLAG
jgi:Ca2+/H+ antiporter